MTNVEKAHIAGFIQSILVSSVLVTFVDLEKYSYVILTASRKREVNKTNVQGGHFQCKGSILQFDGGPSSIPA